MTRAYEQVISRDELAQIEAEEAQYAEWQDAQPLTACSWPRPRPASVLCGGCHGSGVVEATGRLCRQCRATGDVPQRRSDRIRSTWGLRK